MKNGYKIHWTDFALKELEQTITYLEKNFSEIEIQKLARKIETTIELIANNPLIFPKSDLKDIHKAVVLRFNTLYYRVVGDEIQILSFFSNRQSEEKRKI